MRNLRLTASLAALLVWLGPTPCFAQESPVEKQLARFFEDPAYQRALWAVKFQSVESGEILYQENADKLVLPASNMKLLTALASLEKLGPDFRFETRVVTDGEIRNGVLAGNLIVIGSGDPTLGARLSSPDLEHIEKGDPLAVFRDWAEKLRQLGIHRIEGDLIGDDSVFDSTVLGNGWSWDDLPYGYSAEVSGLQFNENCVLVRVTPGSSPGEPIVTETSPDTAYFTLTNELETGERYETAEYSVEREPGTNHAVIKGNLPAGDPPFWIPVAIDNPTLFFMTVLRETLENSGIELGGRVLELGRKQAESDRRTQTLLSHRSPDLSYVLRVLLKVSQNLYAESLVRALDGREAGKSYDEGKREVEDTLMRIGVPQDAYLLADGSGLSRYSLVTADLLVRLLHYIHHRPYRDQFLSFLPVAGVDGTLESRMKGTAAEKKVQAKTGALSNVRALSGYVKTQDGDTVAFAMIVNNYTQPRRSAEYLQDLALEYLASLRR